MEGEKTVVKTTKIYRMMAAVLIAAMSIGFTSCSKDEKKPETDNMLLIIQVGKWFYWRQDYNVDVQSIISTVEFNKDGSYSLKHPIFGDITGMYKITEQKENATYIRNENDNCLRLPPSPGGYKNAKLYKMLASGSNSFEELWVYIFPNPLGLGIEFYSNKQLVDTILYLKDYLPLFE